MGKSRKKPIDNVTIDRLDVVLRYLNISIPPSILDVIIDAVEIIEEKGGDVDINDLTDLKNNHGNINNNYHLTSDPFGFLHSVYLKDLESKDELQKHYKKVYNRYISYDRHRESEQVFYLKNQMATLLKQYQSEIKRLSNPHKIYAINPRCVHVPIFKVPLWNYPNFFIGDLIHEEQEYFDQISLKTETIKFEDKKLDIFLNLTLRDSVLNDVKLKEEIYRRLVKFLIESEAVEFKENHIERRLEVSLKVVS